MTPCHYSRVVINTFSAHGAPDLPDALAGHLDDCATCRAHFDATFLPVSFSRPQQLPPRRRWPAAMALAAAALVTLFSAMAPQPTPLESSAVELALADAECPTDELDAFAVCPLEGELL